MPHPSSSILKVWGAKCSSLKHLYFQTALFSYFLKVWWSILVTRMLQWCIMESEHLYFHPALFSYFLNFDGIDPFLVTRMFWQIIYLKHNSMTYLYCFYKTFSAHDLMSTWKCLHCGFRKHAHHTLKRKKIFRNCFIMAVLRLVYCLRLDLDTFTYSLTPPPPGSIFF